MAEILTLHVIIAHFSNLVALMAGLFGCTVDELELEAGQFVSVNESQAEAALLLAMNDTCADEETSQLVSVAVDRAVVGYPVFTVTLNCSPRMYQARHRFRVFKSFNQVFKQLLPNITLQSSFPTSRINKSLNLKSNSDYLDERKLSLEKVCF